MALIIKNPIESIPYTNSAEQWHDITAHKMTADIQSVRAYLDCNLTLVGNNAFALYATEGNLGFGIGFELKKELVGNQWEHYCIWSGVYQETNFSDSKRCNYI